MQANRTGQQVSLMIWDAFGSALRYLYPLGRNNSEQYIEILEAFLPLVKDGMKAANTSNPVFMQDNSSTTHTLLKAG